MPDKQTPLRDLALISRRVMDLLRRNQLDFCCQGATAVGEACTEKGVDVDGLLAEIEIAAEEGDRPEDWLERRPEDLIVHLQDRFHEPFRVEMPRLIALAERVVKANADHADCPRGLVDHLRLIERSAEEHFQSEEECFFPILMGSQTKPLPIEAWHREHEEHEEKLVRLRAITGEFQPPPDANDEWRDLYGRFDEMEADLMEHMHLENNVLYRMPGLF